MTDLEIAEALSGQVVEEGVSAPSPATWAQGKAALAEFRRSVRRDAAQGRADVHWQPGQCTRCLADSPDRTVVAFICDACCVALPAV